MPTERGSNGGLSWCHQMGEGSQKHAFLRNEPDWFLPNFERMCQEGRDL